MQDHSHDFLHILGQLAREYQQKFMELENLCRDAQPEWIMQQLKARAELTTDQFRTAQQALFSALVKNQDQADVSENAKAVVTISRCFDEMRILFSILLEYTSKPEK
jgi:hypothetical protein